MNLSKCVMFDLWALTASASPRLLYEYPDALMTGRLCGGFITEAPSPGCLRILSPGNASDRPPGNAALFVSWSTSLLLLVIVLSHLLKHSFNFPLTLTWKVVVIWKICSWISDRILVPGCFLFRVTDFHSNILISSDVTFERVIFEFRRQVSLT